MKDSPRLFGNIYEFSLLLKKKNVFKREKKKKNQKQKQKENEIRLTIITKS